MVAIAIPDRLLYHSAQPLSEARMMLPLVRRRNETDGVVKTRS